MKHKYNFDGCGINRDGERILSLQKREMWNDKSITDFARLAAAAPELLEVLENCLEYLDIAFSAEGDCFGVHHNGATDAFSAAEVVIAKAKSQS